MTGHPKPFRRIARPLTDGEYYPVVNESYLDDDRYMPDRDQFIRSFNLLQKDVIHLFDYIEPDDRNVSAFSSRIYELQLRACTEFENNCKAVMNANLYTLPGAKRRHDINDYFKLNKAMGLENYETLTFDWNGPGKMIKPFIDWSGNTYNTLTWYQAYNQVKHDRSGNFSQANLGNLMKAVAGVYVILYAQLNEALLMHRGLMLNSDDYVHEQNSLFGIKSIAWPTNERYDFEWSTLKTASDPFSNYIF